VDIVGSKGRDEATLFDFEHRTEPVRIQLIRAEEPKVARFTVADEDVTKDGPEPPCRFDVVRPWSIDGDSVVSVVGQPQWLEQPAAICVRAAAHAQVTAWRQRGQCRDKTTGIVERPLRVVTVHPCFEDAEVGRIRAHIWYRHLMRSPGAFDAHTVQLFRTC